MTGDQSPSFADIDPYKARFEAFHRQNPHVFVELKRLALGLLDAGHAFGGMKQLFEVLRYNHALQTTDPDFKLNNNYTAYYARVLMVAEPRLHGFFRLRRQSRYPYDVDLVRLGLRVDDLLTEACSALTDTQP